MSGDPEKDGWERSDFPIVCETCLGDNPYVRMTKSEYDKECKVCTRPFTVFRWKAGTKGRFKKTEICQTCAKLKNVCQTCLLDLTFNLPVQVRDSALPMGFKELDIPMSDVNRDYFAQIASDRVNKGLLPYNRAQYNPNISRLARNEPYYERNRAPICSFWLKGNCNRSTKCPFRHEKPDENSELSKQNIKDRYYGVNDPVAKKMLKKMESKELTTPEDPSIKTLYIGNVDERITVQKLESKFYYYGEIKNISIKLNQNCAFIEFTTRDAAESAAEQLHNNLIIDGISLKLSWAKPHREDYSSNPPPGYNNSNDDYYPSMDPQRLGSVPLGPQLPRSRASKEDSTFIPPLINTTPNVNTAPDVGDD
jgi:pre-mRNA-splicing factor RBM22/SLT11